MFRKTFFPSDSLVSRWRKLFPKQPPLPTLEWRNAIIHINLRQKTTYTKLAPTYTRTTVGRVGLALALRRPTTAPRSECEGLFRRQRRDLERPGGSSAREKRSVTTRVTSLRGRIQGARMRLAAVRRGEEGPFVTTEMPVQSLCGSRNIAQRAWRRA